MDKIVGIAGVITAMATACAAVVGFMRMLRRAEPPNGVPADPARADPPRATVPAQAWPGSARPATPPTPPPNPTATSWYQQVPRVTGNSWAPVDPAVSDSPIPEQGTPPSGSPNQWWHGAQSGDRIRTPSRYGP